MDSFRDDLYERYVSSFKHTAPEELERAARANYPFLDFKYLPLLEATPREARILELGAGSGGFLAWLRDRGFKNATGVDVSSEQSRLAHAHGVVIEVADVFDYLRENTRLFDVIVGIDFAEHFSRSELMRLIPLIASRLRVRGVLILQTPNGSGLFAGQVLFGDLTHMTVLTPDSIRQLLSLHGFGEFEFFETGPVPNGLRGRIRSFAWWIIKKAANTVRRIEARKRQDLWTENLICRCTKSPEKNSTLASDLE